MNARSELIRHVRSFLDRDPGLKHVAERPDLEAAQDAFELNCPNCPCLVDTRIQKHVPSVRCYREPLPGERAHA